MIIKTEPRTISKSITRITFILNLKEVTSKMSREKVGLEGILNQCGSLEANFSFFYRTYASAEIDLIVDQGQERIGYEFKCSVSIFLIAFSKFIASLKFGQPYKKGQDILA